MRLLLIISQYSPSQTPNTLRWLPLVRELQSKGDITVSVLTTHHSGCKDKEQQDGVTIYRTGHNTLLDRGYNFLRSDRRRNVANQGPSGAGRLRGLLEKLVDKTWRNNYWPDGSKLFLKPGIQTGQQIIATDKITHILSVGLPFTCHWIAKTLKEQNPALHWHMDIQDPFSYSKEFWVNNFSKYAAKNNEAEEEAFDLADSISVTNNRAGERYKELFPAVTPKLREIPPCFHKEDYGDSYNMILYPEKIHLGYFGSFYTAVRSPLPFLKFLSFLQVQDENLFDRIQLHFVGQLDSVSEAMIDSFPELRGHLIRHGFKSRVETLDAMSQVDILINFGNTTDYHLPSKVVDYLYMNKPVLNIISTENDSTKAFLKGKTELLNLDLDKNQYEAQKAAFLAFALATRAKEQPDYGKVAAYSTGAIADSYLEELGY